MSVNQNELNGFNISIKTLSAGDKGSAGNAEILSAKRLGEQIAEFITTACPVNLSRKVIVSLEKWDDSFVLEESVYEIEVGSIKQDPDYSRNYWIETKNN